MKLIVAETTKIGCTRFLEGSTADDLLLHRPGFKAITEMDINSPLLEAGITKKDIHSILADWNLEQLIRPSNSCLLTRFPHGTHITQGLLKKAYKAESILEQHGFPGSRARIWGNIIRIEVHPQYLNGFLVKVQDNSLVMLLKNLGFSHVTLDLEGYRTGSMDIQEEKYNG